VAYQRYYPDIRLDKPRSATNNSRSLGQVWELGLSQRQSMENTVHSCL